MGEINGCFPSESTSSVYIDFTRKPVGDREYVKGRICAMYLTIESVYYLIAIVSIACGAAYKLGYANGKNAKK